MKFILHREVGIWNVLPQEGVGANILTFNKHLGKLRVVRITFGIVRLLNRSQVQKLGGNVDGGNKTLVRPQIDH